MTFAGQAFWREAERGLVSVVPCCPACGRPSQLRRDVMPIALEVAERAFGASEAGVTGVSQMRRATAARSLLVWALHSLGTGQSYSQIGRLLGGRHHSTIINLHQKAINLRLRDPAFAQACKDIADGYYLWEGGENAGN